MKAITTEVCLALGESQTIFSSCRAMIRVEDLAAGPFLLVEGIDDEPDGHEEFRRHSFALQSEEEIDAFAEVCKRVLREAQS